MGVSGASSVKSFFLITDLAGTVKSSSGRSGCTPSTSDGTVVINATASALTDKCKPRMRSIPTIHVWLDKPPTTYTGALTAMPRMSNGTT